MASTQAEGRPPRSFMLARVIISSTAGAAMVSVLLVPAVSSNMLGVADITVMGLVAVFWLSPLLYYWFRVVTATAAWLLGLAYIGVSAWLVTWIYRSDPEAAVGFFFLPTFLWAGMLMGIDVDRALARWALLRGQRNTSGHRGSSSAAIRLGRRAPVWQWMLPTGVVLALLSFVWWKAYLAWLAVTWSVTGAVVSIGSRRRDQSSRPPRGAAAA